MPGMDPVELNAAAVAASIVGARAVRRDAGGKSLRDFDLVFLDASIEPLEVTRHAQAAVVQTHERLRKFDHRAPTLSRYWAISVPNSERRVGEKDPVAYDVRRLSAHAEPALRALEQAGYEKFDLGLMIRDPSVAGALRQLAQLGCDAGFSHPLAPGETGLIHPVAGVGGLIHDDLIADAIEQEAGKRDNQRKLSQPPGARRRHLFVIADSSTSVISAAHRGMTGRVPVLPEPITTAWILGSTTAYCVTPPARWESHPVPDDVFVHPELWVDW